MPAPADQRNLTLFVPADRPGRVAKAAGVGADAVIVFLKDAVVPEARDAARSHGPGRCRTQQRPAQRCRWRAR